MKLVTFYLQRAMIFGGMLTVVHPMVGYCARVGIVDQKEAPLYETIGEAPKVKMFLKRGTEVRASNYPTNGYYKVESEGKSGWIRTDQIILKQGIVMKPPIVEAPIPQNQDQPFITDNAKDNEKGRPIQGSKNVVKTRDKGVRMMWRR